MILSTDYLRRSPSLQLKVGGGVWVHILSGSGSCIYTLKGGGGPDHRFLGFHGPKSSKVTESWPDFYFMSNISQQHILKDRVFIIL